ncbi:cyclic nucleotide-binding protein [Actinorhabdospora filicis]|uniref:Cyclic nucleotide-binding protein n=1 Tax=Actinorhabdospora filicis TaxID=1785913 RepID=A0A9W6WCL3_9ACTN|nr:Crp/Fnr family transcriptional regulator [Actinorhabdospora filicis]GLZ81754.1 cyclic nucleotide-binding protein [Actinorhabdospora filicis]
MGDWPTGTFLHRLPRPDRVALESLGVSRRAVPGTVLLRAGEPGAHALLLQRALVKIAAPGPGGRDVLLAIRAPGDLVGDVAVLNDRPRGASVVACGEVYFRLITQTDLRTYLRRYPAAALELAGLVSDRLRWANERRADAPGLPAETRLARALAELGSSYGESCPRGVEIGLDITQPELAALIGVSEKTVYRALIRLREDGLIDTGFRRIFVTDHDGLLHAGHLTP